mgnify:CR=1 FL=1
MPKVSPIQNNFSAGEMSPLFKGRTDADRYKNALATCKNYLPTIQGGLIRRPGTVFVSETKDSTKKSRLIQFEFSTTQAYMLEFGHQYIRFYKDNALITLASQNLTAATQANPVVVTYAGSDTYANGDRVIITGVSGMTQLNNREFIVANVNTGANTFELKDTTGTNVNGTAYDAYTSGGSISEIYEIASPYVEADLFQIKFTQSADVIYLVHPTYAPRKLTRTAHTAWTLDVINFLDGPYLTTNTTGTTLTPSAFSGAGITLTASSIVGINNDTGFQSTDVGRLIRIKEGSVWGYVKIVGWTSTTVVTADVISTLTNNSAKTTWRMGFWSGTTGYPSCVVFHEDRLMFGGSPASPQRLDGSRTSDYENFAPTETDGSVGPSNALAFSFNSNDVNVVRWLAADEKGLITGTVGNEWLVRPSSFGEALTPTNINAKKSTSYGSADIQPVQVGKATLFIQRAGRKLREMTYFYDADGFRASDITVLAEHVTGNGITQLAYQREPQSIVWGVRNDGVLTSMLYERDVDNINVGWARHVIGGYSDAANSDAVVESVGVIPSPGTERYDTWLIVRRRINGRTVRYVEYLSKLFEDLDEQREAFFVDSGLTYDDPKTITGATQANPVVITSNSHGFSNGDVVLITGVKGMSELNTETFTVAGVTANTFQLSGINGTSYSTYVSGGEVRKYVTTITGLNHLEGETVSICADGAALPNEVVTKGKVTLSNRSTTVHIGFGYMSDAQILRIDAGSADGTAIGKKRRTHIVAFMLHRTLGMKIGLNFEELDEQTFRTSSDPMTRAPALFTGILENIHLAADYDYENQICWRQDQPLPGMILAIMPQMITQDRG